MIQGKAEAMFEGMLNREIYVSSIKVNGAPDAKGNLGFVEFWFNPGSPLTYDQNGDAIVPQNVVATCKVGRGADRKAVDAGGVKYTAKVKSGKFGLFLVTPGYMGHNADGSNRWVDKLWYKNQFSPYFNNADVSAGLLALWQWAAGLNYIPNPSWRIDKFKDVCKGPDMGCANSIYIGQDDEAGIYDAAVGSDSIMNVVQRTRPCIVCGLTGKYMDKEACDTWHESTKHNVKSIERQTAYASASGYVSDSVSAVGKAVINTEKGKEAVTLNQLRFRFMSALAKDCPFFRYNKKAKDGSWVSERPSAAKVMPWSMMNTATYAVENGQIKWDTVLGHTQDWESGILPFEMTPTNPRIIPQGSSVLVRYATQNYMSVTVPGPFRIIASGFVFQKANQQVLDMAAAAQAQVNARIEEKIAKKNSTTPAVAPQPQQETVADPVVDQNVAQLATALPTIIEAYKVMDVEVQAATRQKLDMVFLDFGQKYPLMSADGRKVYENLVKSWMNATK